MSWRPELDKEQIKRDATTRYDLAALLRAQKGPEYVSILPVILDALIDATADAMLGALKARARLIEEHLIQVSGNGTWVFIPDDEKEQG